MLVMAASAIGILHGPDFSPVGQPFLYELHPQLATNRQRRTGQRTERDRVILGIKQPVELRPAALHALCQLGLREPLRVSVCPVRAEPAGAYNPTRRSLSAFATTLTEDRAMAAAAITGDSRMPKKG
jgi:hypothetical protein